jgi:hypothetical protein
LYHDANVVSIQEKGSPDPMGRGMGNGLDPIEKPIGRKAS